MVVPKIPLKLHAAAAPDVDLGDFFHLPTAKVKGLRAHLTSLFLFNDL
jgi:hypothetical protein